MTLTVTSFNASTGRVNATLSHSDLELLLSGASAGAASGCEYLLCLCSVTALVHLEKDSLGLGLTNDYYCINTDL